ncbi:MAG: HAD-IIA family hydrolase [Fimbriimonas sp.]
MSELLHQLYIFDLDGTLYRGNDPIEGAAETLQELHRRGKVLRYLTNNSSQTIQFQADKLVRMGFPVEAGSVMTSALGMARYLRSKGIERVFVVGEAGLVSTLIDGGIVVTEDSPEAVVVGICRTFTYDLMNQALQFLRGGLRLIATNKDTTFPLEGGRVVPGAGSIVAAIEACSGQQAHLVGKPSAFLVQELLAETGVAADRTLVVGDRYDTDIMSGMAAGCDTLMVLTGIDQTAPIGIACAADVRAILG